ncbi:unnamed protein product [Aphanomyces euteiches]|uniref:Secreted protein n=1 Tax=Aphanomyces euteiches TaxID=100861 RepID=A0A6G0W6Q9_9STRA|nr:hypothetical protein Ae201684_018412 [Aphanomyces euteiches]KAH9095091.1 hypothetical protein Ae201684P_013682 [Aphanomyces euteiches]KAH9139284.1 hypothetical protein AeRB84_016441 [Aphanomyces euteiches]
MRTLTFLAASLVVALGVPCDPSVLKKANDESFDTPEGKACAARISIPASAYGNKTVVVEYTARSYEQSPECATWWPVLAAKLKAISPVCDVRPNFSTQDYAALNLTDMAADFRRDGGFFETNQPMPSTPTVNSTNATDTVTTSAPTSSGAATSTNTTAAPTTTKVAPSSGSIMATTTLSCLVLGLALH